MDYALSDEHAAFRSTLRSFFAEHATTAVVAQYDRSETFPSKIWDGMVELGLMGMATPVEYGGTAADELALCIANEEIARASAALLYAWSPTVCFCARGIALFGTEEQKRAYLPAVAGGTLRFAMGLTEPDAGSDLTSLRTTAVSDGDAYVVSGQKVFTTGADQADFIFAFVRVAGDNPRALSVVLIPTDADGVVIRPLAKLAGQATHTCEVFLSDVRVPLTSRVGQLGDGSKIIFKLLDADRIYVGAAGCGIAQGALDQALAHARHRVQFGKPIIEFQAVGHMVADMLIETEMARLLVWRAAARLQAGLPCSLDAAMAKIAGSEVGTRCAGRGMQILGGYSYMVEYGMERYWRECKLMEIAGGSNEIQRNIIVRQLLQDWPNGS